MYNYTDLDPLPPWHLSKKCLFIRAFKKQLLILVECESEHTETPAARSMQKLVEACSTQQLDLSSKIELIGDVS